LICNILAGIRLTTDIISLFKHEHILYYFKKRRPA
jgi:hypothetical protein